MANDQKTEKPASAELEEIDREIRDDLQNARNMANSIYLETLAEIKELENDLLENVLPLLEKGGVNADQVRQNLKNLFNFALGRNVAFDSLMKTIGKQFHREIAVSIERNFPNDLEKFYEFLILHWGEAGEYTKAVTYCVRAAESARKSGNEDKATSLCNRGLKFLETALESPRAKEDPRELATVHYQTGLIHQAKNDQRAAIESFERARGQFSTVGDQSSLATCLSSLGMAYRALGNLEAALKSHRGSLEIRTKLGEMKKAVITLNNIGIVYCARGQFTEALAEFREAGTLAREIHDEEGTKITQANLSRAQKLQSKQRK